MPQDPIQKLNSLLELLQNDTITPKELEQFLNVFVDVVKKTKDGFETITADRVAQMQVVFQKIVAEHNKVLEKLEASNLKALAETKKELDEKMRRATNMLQAISEIEVHDGKDADEELIVEKVITRLPKPEKVELDTAEQIVTKLNTLDQPWLDAKYIKNLPTQTGGWKGGGSRYMSRLADVKITDLQDGEALIWNADNGRFENGTVSSGGGAWGTITGTLSDQTDLQTALDGKANALGADDNYVTDAEKVKLSNLSGTNTGDQDLSGLMVKANNLSDLTNAGTARTNLGVAIGTNVQAQNTNLQAIADLADPNADRILFWDDSAGVLKYLTIGTNLSITDTTLNASGGGGVAWGAISGTLSDQTDLQTELDGKQDVITGLTASGAELNILDGATLTTTELNYVDGVTSAIQTQLDGKVNTDQTVGQTIGTTGARLTKLWATDITVTNAITGSVTGNAGTATALLNARTIGGVSFDGTANITVATATGGFTISGGNLALGTNSITMSGSIGVTGTRVTKGWFTDLEVTNAIVGSITGNAATVTNATFTTALTVNTGTLTLTANAANNSVLTIGAGAVSVSGTNTGDQSLFRTIAVSGQSDVVADSTTDTLTLVAGTNVTITTDAGTDTITISATGGEAGVLQDGEEPTGTINSVNTDFVLSYTPSNPGGVIVLLDGVVQYNGTDYTITDDTITFTTAPVTGSTIFAYAGVTGAEVAGANTALSNLASVAINTSLISDTNETDDLGSAAIKWNNLFVKTIGATGTRVTQGWFTDITVTNAISGSVTGNAGTATALQNARTIGGVSFDGTANITVATATGGFTVSGGNLALGTNSLTLTGSIASTGSRVTKVWTADLESTNMPTVGGVAILTSLTAPQFTTIELGHASDTTISRVSAGVLAVEGVQLLTVAGGTLTGSITLGENTSIALDPAGSADGKWSGITIAGTAGYTQAFGDLVYLDPTDSRWEMADANSAAAADGDARGILGMVVSAGTDGTACTILLQGMIRADAKFPSFTINNPIYVSETAGAVTQTQPTTTDVVIRIVGSAMTADEMYFNPDRIWITKT